MRQRIAAVLVIFAALIWAGSVGAPIERTKSADAEVSDIDLYKQVAERVAAGESYYPTIVEIQRETGFPLRPASTVRMPTMAYITGHISPIQFTIALFVANIVIGIGMLAGNFAEKVAAGVLLGMASFMAFDPGFAYLHDMWAGLLLSLGLFLYNDRRWWITWLLAVIAVAIREHAIVFAAVFGVFSLYQKRWAEVIAWSLLGGAFLVGTVLHYSAVEALTTDADVASVGWLWLLGPKAFLNDILALTLLRLLPMWLAGPLALLPFLGWAVLKDKRPLAVFLSYALLFCFVGREINYYWGFLVLPAYLAGLALVPRAMVQFWRNDRKVVGADGLEPPTLSV